MTSCGHCHACGNPIKHVLGEKEWCPNCRAYQRPVTHGYHNPAPSAVEQHACTQTPAPPSEQAADSTDIWAGAEILSRYTRRQAIEDGVLVEIPESIRKEFGIVFPLAMTRTVWDDYIAVPESLRGLQDEQGRLADVLMMFRLRAKQCQDDQFLFRVIIQQEKDKPLPAPITLKAVIDGGDAGEGAITIMLPNED
ncbi:MAG TPA: DUF6573 family protein [Nitrospira sp.]|nr:DUF6573 family protein [Nitrospira sp.]